ncbi:hypothetical protein M3Y99_01989800 [Aphelenchoides fujianensis]|nr:hypothetical protein M3Y99_01989800 [Aphelenchoides fujianensis]
MQNFLRNAGKWATVGQNKAFFVVLVPDQLLVKQRKSQAEANRDRDRLNQLQGIVDECTEEANLLADLIAQALAHRDWLEIHLLTAVGCNELVEELCSKDPLKVVNTPTPSEGLLPLHIAVKRKDWPLAQRFLDYGADLRKCDLSGCNSLHYAAFKIHREEQFVAALHAENVNNNTPLHFALRTERGNCVKFLVDCGADSDVHSLNIAEFGVTPKALDALLSCNRNALLGDPSKKQTTFLHHPFSNDLLRVVHMNCPEMVDHPDKDDRTPLHAACVRKDLNGAVSLLAHGASVDVQGKLGNTPLHLAVEKDELIVKLLLCFDADVQVENKAGKLPANMSGSAGMAKIFSDLKKTAEQSSKGVCHELPAVIRHSHQSAVEHQKSLEAEVRQQSLRLLSLDGGGIRGVCLTILLLHIEKFLDGERVVDFFDWIAGTSTGAILALALVDGYPLIECLRIYLRLKDEVFKGSRPHDPAPLEAFLKAEFQERTLDQLTLDKRVLVTTCRADTHPPKLVLLRNYELPVSLIETMRPADVAIWKAARCSSAAPTFFPRRATISGRNISGCDSSGCDFSGRDISGRAFPDETDPDPTFPDEKYNVFLDGGLIANNPTMDLLTEVQHANMQRRKNNEDPLPIACVVSLGTGVLPPQPMESLDLDLPKGFNGVTSLISDVANAAFTLNGLKNIFVEQLAISDGQVVERCRAFADALQTPFFRYTPKLAVECPLNTRDNVEIVRLMWATKLFALSLSTEEMHQIVSLLKRGQ